MRELNENIYTSIQIIEKLMKEHVLGTIVM